MIAVANAQPTTATASVPQGNLRRPVASPPDRLPFPAIALRASSTWGSFFNRSPTVAVSGAPLVVSFMFASPASRWG